MQQQRYFSPSTLSVAYTNQGFKEALVSDMFAWSTFVNGLVAIFAGILANFLSDLFGYVAPFMAAMVFLIVTFFIISASWSENYGEVSLLHLLTLLIRRERRITMSALAPPYALCLATGESCLWG
jgi:hypothetical protein